MSKFADAVNDYLIKNNMSQMEFAKMCGVSPPVIGRYIKDTAKPRLKTKRKVMRILEGHEAEPIIEDKIKKALKSKADRQVDFMAKQFEVIICAHAKITDGCKAAANFVIAFMEISK